MNGFIKKMNEFYIGNHFKRGVRELFLCFRLLGGDHNLKGIN